VSAVTVDVERPSRGGLELRYELIGQLTKVAMPPHAEGRGDNLWEHTCLEAFIRGIGQARYCEFNFSPSTQWAAYAFDEYRKGMCNLDSIGNPHRAYEFGPERFALSTRLELTTSMPPEKAWRLALSAVIEETNGVKSYWALNHPPGKPDFHHADGFVLELP
jgi:hypothetical protein